MIQRVDPLSVLRVAAVLHLCVAVVGLALGVILWLVARAGGILANVESFIGDLFALEDFHFVAWRILRATALGGAVFVVVGSAASLAVALLYNAISRVVGGITVSTVDEDAPVGVATTGSQQPVKPRRVIV